MGKTAKYLLGTILIIFVAFVISVVICILVDSLNVKRIEILNNERFDDAYYMSEVADLAGVNGIKVLFGDIVSIKSFFMIFALRDYKIEQQYMVKNPFVRNVKVRFVPPDKIQVEIFERKESYKLSFLDREIYLSKDLIVLGEELGKEVPELTGLNITTYELGEMIPLNNEKKKALSEIFENSVYNGRSISDKIIKIDFEDNLEMVLSNGVTVIFGGYDDIKYKMHCLNEIYYEYLYEYSSGKLDISDKDTKIYSP